jgi:hypothetical protein
MTVERTHSTWFHFVKQPRYFAAVDEIREPHVESDRGFSGIKDSGTKRRLEGGANQGFGLAGEFVREYNPLGKLPGSVWQDLSWTEVVERIVKGWSPSGVCTACGEGRRPVVNTKQVKSPVHGDGSIMGSRRSPGDIRGWDGLPRFNVERSITGWTCQCTTSTGAEAAGSALADGNPITKQQLPPTRPPVVLIQGDDADPLGSRK